MKTLHSKIADVLEKNIKDEELLNKTKGKFHAIEVEIDGRLNKENADVDNVLNTRAKELIGQIFGYAWMSANWEKVKRDIKEEIDDSRR